MTDPRSRIRMLDWDSTLFGKRLARIEPGSLTPETLGEIVRAGEQAQIDSLSYLADPSDSVTLRALERHTFELVDVRLELEMRVRERVTASGIRHARSDDLPVLTDLARTSHRNTRFYVDSRFEEARADELYALWIERSVRNEIADAVLVPEVNGWVTGYMSLSRGADGTAQIGLIAVHAKYRGQGTGAKLIAAAHEWCGKHQCTVLRVVTPGRGAASLRFYEREGFLTRGIGFWYHRWL